MCRHKLRVHSGICYTAECCRSLSSSYARINCHMHAAWVGGSPNLVLLPCCTPYTYYFFPPPWRPSFCPPQRWPLHTFRSRRSCSHRTKRHRTERPVKDRVFTKATHKTSMDGSFAHDSVARQKQAATPTRYPRSQTECETTPSRSPRKWAWHGYDRSTGSTSYATQ